LPCIWCLDQTYRRCHETFQNVLLPFVRSFITLPTATPRTVFRFFFFFQLLSRRRDISEVSQHFPIFDFSEILTNSDTIWCLFFRFFFLFRMCACVLVCIVCGMCSLTIDCVLVLYNVFSYGRMCSLTIDCVLLLQNVFSCIVCVYRVCVCMCACAYVCACVRACVDVCMEGGECQCVCKPSLLNPKP